MAQMKSVSKEYEELVNKINEFFENADITVETLKNPTPEAVSKFYNAFLEELGVNTANLLQIQMNQMTLIDHVDMFSATVPLLNLYNGINYFFKELNVNDFVLTDLTNPNPKRTVTHFRTIMSFINYCDFTIGNYDDEVSKIYKMRSKHDELVSKLELVRGELNKNATERVKRRENMEKLKNLIEADTQKMNEVLKERQVYQTAVDEKRKLLEQTTNREAEAVKMIKTLEDDIRELQGMLVTSPDKLKSDLSALTQKKEECLESLKNLKMQIEEKQQLNHDLLKKQEEQKCRQEMIDEFLKMKNLSEEVMREHEILVTKYKKMVEKREQDAHKIDELERNVNKLETNLIELKNLKEKQDVDLKEIVKKAEKDLNAICMSMKEQKAYKDHLQMQINLLHEELQERQEEYKEYRAEYHKMSEKLSIWANNLIETYENLMKEDQF